MALSVVFPDDSFCIFRRDGMQAAGKCSAYKQGFRELYLQVGSEFQNNPGALRCLGPALFSEGRALHPAASDTAVISDTPKHERLALLNGSHACLIFVLTFKTIIFHKGQLSFDPGLETEG